MWLGLDVEMVQRCRNSEVVHAEVYIINMVLSRIRSKIGLEPVFSNVAPVFSNALNQYKM